MRVEQWRLGSLSSENGADITFEEIKDDEDEAVIYFYACECIGQIHDVPSGIHKKIQNYSNFKFLKKYRNKYGS